MVGAGFEAAQNARVTFDRVIPVWQNDLLENVVGNSVVKVLQMDDEEPLIYGSRRPITGVKVRPNKKLSESRESERLEGIVWFGFIGSFFIPMIGILMGLVFAMGGDFKNMGRLFAAAVASGIFWFLIFAVLF